MKVDLTRSISPSAEREKAIRLLWAYFVWPMVAWIPRGIGSKLRVLALRCFGGDIGPSCLIESGVRILIPWNLRLKGFVAIGRNAEIYNHGQVTIERMVVVSQYCYLCTGTHDYTNPALPLRWEPILVCSEAWLGAGTWVLPGVTIGEGAVVGARSLVTKDVPEWTVSAGHPCRVIKPRKMKEANDA